MSTKSVVIGVGLFAAGAGAGYLVSNFIVKKKVEALITKEIEDFKESYAPFNKTGIYATPESAVDALIPLDENIVAIAKEAGDILKAEGYTEVEDDTLEESFDKGLEPEIVTHNVWDDHGDDVADEEFEEAKLKAAEVVEVEESTDDEGEDVVPEDEMIFPRDADHPYIISTHQFMHDGMHADDKEELLYFEADETLVDDNEHIVPDVEYIVGNANLHNFGKGSGNKNTLYVRNEKTGVDYEISRDKRAFTEVVLGIKPAKSGAPLRMRNDDQ